MRRLLLLLLALPSLFAQSESQPIPALQERIRRAALSPQTWRARAAEIRQHILASSGLWPLFDRPPLKPVVFGRMERAGYTIEKVRFETWPGFHLTGNLYRPSARKGPFPVVLSPHGHAKPGRFFDGPNSEQGRAITLAKLGMLVFAYDMIGYADLTQVPHAFENPWGLSLLGLQIWNSIRAVDFVSSLPDIDTARIAVSGASGGGTQSYMLAAVDDRIAVSAPVCMVAAEFQGGCSCENAPVLRIGLNNVEIAAAAAPRPLLIVSATGDWTKDSLKIGCPAIGQVYKTLGAEERFRCVQHDAKHNYNQDSRESVYAWLTRWLLNARDRQRLPEPPFTEEKPADLAVFSPDHPRPADSVDAAGLQALLKEKIRAQLDALAPRDAATLEHFRQVMTTALRHAFTATWPEPGVSAPAGFEALVPERPSRRATATLVVGSETEGSRRLAQALLKSGDLAFVLRPGPHQPEPDAPGVPVQRKNYPTTYYRTSLAWAVQDTLTALAHVAARPDVREIRLVGLGKSGIAALVARALAPDKRLRLTIADVGGIDDAAEATWSTGEHSHPLMLRIGGLRTAATVAAPAPLAIHNTQNRFQTDGIRTAYRAAGRERALTVSQTRWGTDEILRALEAKKN